MSRIDRLMETISKPIAQLAAELGVPPIVAAIAQVRAAERLLPFVVAK